jgi:hypothetical protein
LNSLAASGKALVSPAGYPAGRRPSEIAGRGRRPGLTDGSLSFIGARRRRLWPDCCGAGRYSDSACSRTRPRKLPGVRVGLRGREGCRPASSADKRRGKADLHRAAGHPRKPAEAARPQGAQH